MGEELRTMVPPVALLGIAKRAHVSKHGGFEPELDLFGISMHVPTHLYPISLADLHLVLSLYEDRVLGGKIRFYRPDGTEMFHFGFAFSATTRQPGEAPPASRNYEWAYYPGDRKWIPLLLRLPDFTLTEPITLKIAFSDDNHGEMLLGSIRFLYVPAPELTEEQIDAIRSNPIGSQTVKVQFTCKVCADGILVYRTVNPSANPTSDAVEQREVPDEFICKCGATRIPLRYTRESLQALLGKPAGPIQFRTETYERRALEAACRDFADLLDTAGKEEEVQKFLSEQPIFFHQFTPTKFFTKKPVLTYFKTDFAILSASGTLWLIEIETPSAKLLKTDGGASAELTHACDQVRSWLHCMAEHRQACLQCMGIESGEVSKVEGVVIMGRNKNHPAEYLRRLKFANYGDIRLMTFDDLLDGMLTVVSKLSCV